MLTLPLSSSPGAHLLLLCGSCSRVGTTISDTHLDPGVISELHPGSPVLILVDH